MLLDLDMHLRIWISKFKAVGIAADISLFLSLKLRMTFKNGWKLSCQGEEQPRILSVTHQSV